MAGATLCLRVLSLQFYLTSKLLSSLTYYLMMSMSAEAHVCTATAQMLIIINLLPFTYLTQRYLFVFQHFLLKICNLYILKLRKLYLLSYLAKSRHLQLFKIFQITFATNLFFPNSYKYFFSPTISA